MQCKSYSHFFSKKFHHICVSLIVNFNESLTNDVVSFEQVGPDFQNSAFYTPAVHGFLHIATILLHKSVLMGFIFKTILISNIIWVASSQKIPSSMQNEQIYISLHMHKVSPRFLLYIHNSAVFNDSVSGH